MNNFQRITASREALAAFLGTIPAIETPWDDAFHRIYCSSCSAADCDDCRRPERDSPLWWLGLPAYYTKTDNKEDFDMDINEARKQLTSCADTGDTPSAWAKEAAEYCKRKGIFNGDGAGNFGWQQPITREAVACIIYRALEAAGALGNLSDV